MKINSDIYEVDEGFFAVDEGAGDLGRRRRHHPPPALPPPPPGNFVIYRTPLVERSFEHDLDAAIQSLTGLSLCSSRINPSLDESRVGTSNGALDMPSFQGVVQDHTNSSMAQENSKLKEQIRTLERDNAILKQGVLILYRRHKQLEENTQELVESMNQNKEKLKNLEVTNYALRMHLMRQTQQSSSIGGNFLPDVF